MIGGHFPLLKACSCVLVLQVLLASTTALAGDAEAAQEAFDRGLEAMKQENYAEGCPALRESFRLDPKPGALFTLGACEAQWEHFATAVAEYRRFVALHERMEPAEQAEQQKRADAAAAEIERLQPLVPHLTLLLPEDVEDRAVIHLDGRTLARAEYTQPIPVDPGDHTVLVEQPGTAPREHRVVLAAREQRSLDIPLLRQQPPPPPPPPASPSTQRTLAYVAAGVGAAGLVVGGITGILAIGQAGTVDERCVDRRCDAEGLDAVDTGQTFALVSTVGFAVGVAAAAAAVVLYLTEPDPSGVNAAGVMPFYVGAPTDAPEAMVFGASGRF